MKKEHEGCSQEVDALLRFYGGRKLISKKDIIEFSRIYIMVQTKLMPHTQHLYDEKGELKSRYKKFDKEINEREHDDSEDCWCCPTIVQYEHGNVIVHNRPN